MIEGRSGAPKFADSLCIEPRPLSCRKYCLLDRWDLIGPKILGYEMPPERSVNLDNQQDCCWLE